MQLLYSLFAAFLVFPGRPKAPLIHTVIRNLTLTNEGSTVVDFSLLNMLFHIAGGGGGCQGSLHKDANAF